MKQSLPFQDTVETQPRGLETFRFFFSIISRAEASSF